MTYLVRVTNPDGHEFVISDTEDATIDGCKNRFYSARRLINPLATLDIVSSEPPIIYFGKREAKP